MNEQTRHTRFSELIARYQSDLYGYIFAVVRNWEDADDLFQTVCVILWRKFDSFQPDGNSNFFLWARQVARFELSTFLKRKHLPNASSEDLLDKLASVAVRLQEDSKESYLVALRRCRDKLPAADEELLDLRYVDELSVQGIADRLKRLRPHVSRSLSRIRRRLLECVQIEMAQQDHFSEGLS